MTRDEKIELIQARHEQIKRKGRRSLLAFTAYTMQSFRPAGFHRRYYDVLTRFAEGEITKLMVFLPPQHGKLLADSQQVPTPNGMVRHGDLKVGDQVFGRDGKPVNVLWVSPKDKCQYIVEFSDGSRVPCHGNHEWQVYDRAIRKEIVLETHVLAENRLHYGPEGKRGGRYRFQVDANVCVQFNERNVEIDPYTLGAWLGDGKSSAPQITIGCGDTEIIDAIPYKATSSRVQESTGVMYFYFGKQMNLGKYGLVNNKHIPEDYIYNSVDARKQLIAGLIDTDGYVYQENGRVTISNTNKDVIDQAAFILRSLGQSTVICEYEPKTSTSGIIGKKVCYQLCFNPTMEFPTRVPRKAIKTLTNGRRRSIVAIEKADGEQGNCIQVEGGLYLVGDRFILTHNSEGSTRRLPAFLLGQNPDTRLAIISYSASKARKFNRELQRIVDDEKYRELFPGTTLSGGNSAEGARAYVRTSDECEIVGHKGGFKTVGVGGPLTGDPVDILIMDDLYKDAKTAWSPVVRESVDDWYDSVAETRLHNDSQQLIVFTRWHEDDLAGRLLRQQGKYDPVTNPNGWVVVIYEAIKTGGPNEYDEREEGEALWPEMHSLEKLESIRERNPHVFESLYQQDPKPQAGLMYDQGFRTYAKIPNEIHKKRKNYTDTADTGLDFLCSINYVETKSAMYVTNVLYTQRPMEYTEPATAELVTKDAVEVCRVESNNGGRGFCRNVEKQTRAIGNTKTRFKWFHQAQNKAVRIYTHSAEVQNLIYFPEGWDHLWPDFYNAVTNYLKTGKNAHDDAPDVLTGMVEDFKEENKPIDSEELDSILW